MKMPAIEWNGEVVELDVDSLDNPHIRVQVKREQSFSKGYGHDRLKLDQDVFEPIRMGFKIDQTKVVEVVVFVHIAYFRGQPQRKEIIRKYVKRNAPWFFSYGRRYNV